MIPKIIHQTWKNNIIPDNWSAAVESCKSKHADYQYILWTDETMDDFVKSSYPNFYQTYISYKYNIQRCDAFRYMVLYAYGGIYLDMDIICKKKLDNLLTYDIVFVKSENIDIYTNWFLMSIPQHPFILYSIEQLSLTCNKYNFLGKHIHVYYSTGPLFLSNNINKYKLNNIHNNYILLKNESSGDCTICNKDKCVGGSYFSHIKGQSWNDNDSHIYNFILCQYKKIIVFIILIILIIFYYKKYYKKTL